MGSVSSKNANTKSRSLRPRAAPPVLGWVLISRAEVNKAEALLNDRQRGVVDELGLISIHQAISDRLFPGTSVLHTRLRYALFVPWLMQEAAGSKNAIQKLAELEFKLTGRLKHGLKITAAEADDAVGMDQRGVIGSRVHEQNKHAAQPASFSYWSALATWGILGREFTQSAPSRESVMEVLGSHRKSSVATDMDGQPLSTEPSYFLDVPPPPTGFLEDIRGVTFKLRPEERKYLRHRLMALKAPTIEEEASRQSFLGALASGSVKPIQGIDFWDDGGVCALVPPKDEEIIPLARHISALGGVVRAVYLAMVEQACADRKLLTTSSHRDHLQDCRGQWKKEALQADLGAMVSHRLGLTEGPLCDLLSATKDWLRTSSALPDASVKNLYAEVERSRKFGRSRLTGTAGATQQLRRWAKSAEWSANASRLHFRWPNVSRLIRDLHE